MGTAASSASGPLLLSVVVPTRDRQESLHSTLTSLRTQATDPVTYEVLVVDDGSDPPVREVPQTGGPAIHVVRVPHGERSAARNRGAAHARGQILLFVDDDMLADQHLLEAHAAAQAEWPGALVVGAVSLPEEILRTPFGRFRNVLEAGATPRDRGPVAKPNFAAAANMSIPRERFFALGGFDTSIVSSEDQDLALRHSAAGGTIVYLPGAVAVHDDSATSLRAYCRRAEWGAEHMAPFCRRYPDWSENRERWAVNGPISWSEDAPRRALKKLGKQLLGRRLPTALLFALVGRLEAWAPQSRTLPMLYRLALGIHLQRGFRRGWAEQRRNAARAEAGS